MWNWVALTNGVLLLLHQQAAKRLRLIIVRIAIAHIQKLRVAMILWLRVL
jgi:hypothetical protein